MSLLIFSNEATTASRQTTSESRFQVGFLQYDLLLTSPRGMWWHIWLRHCATSWKVMDSIPNGVSGIFH